jgi:hypothetical protein
MKDLTCRDERRRQAIRDCGHNGIDYVDVTGKHLCVHFLTGIPAEILPKEKEKPLTPKEKDAALCHIVIRGGRRVQNIHAISFDPHETDDAFDEACLGIDLDREGDWSTYTLCFVECLEGESTSRPLADLDPRYACVDFNFKIDCPAELDCKTDDACPPPERPRPSINYLAKDYASFRQLILDRLALLMPEWRERHVPDIGIAIVELLAYAGDSLSYYQDAVATEAYLDTARQRMSVRRHARLVDYRIHDGCNARAFLFLQVIKDDALLLEDVYFSVDAAQTIVFEPLDARLKFPVWLAHNEVRIYTWGDEECCIPKGATRATLFDEFLPDQPPPPPPPPPPPVTSYQQRRQRGGTKTPEPPSADEKKEHPRKLRFEVGDFLLFEELACAGTVLLAKEGEGDGRFDPKKPAPMPDVDRTHRHVVRITKRTPLVDPLNGQPVLEVEWDRQDAMPFMLCVSAIGAAPECDLIEPLAVARGNILLTDHGVTIKDEPLEPIEQEFAEEVCEGEDDSSELAVVARPYRPVLKSAPLTFAEPLIKDAPASVLLEQNPGAALPAVTLKSVSKRLHGVNAPEVWTAEYDLLDSSGDDANFVAETDDEERAHLRFGDGDTGRAVEVGMTFAATYRAGNGRAGLVGAETIVHVWFRSGPNNLIAHVRNPLPSTGAIAPEPVAEVKMLAPMAFRKDLQRAITGDDYATLAKYLRYPLRNPRVQNAAGSLIWSGSWYEADVSIDPSGTTALAAPLRDAITVSLGRYRRMGHDLRVAGAQSVPLRLELELCVKPDYLRAHVLAAVRQAVMRFFEPDNVTFGEAVYISRIVAVVMAVDGVAEVKVTRLEPLAEVPKGAPPDSGALKLRPDQIARLDNDPVMPENGLLSFANVRGGR